MLKCMTNRLKYSALILSFLSSRYILSFIGTIYHLHNPQTGQHIFLLGDRHEGHDCGKQQKHILQAAQSLNATIIVEDMLMVFPEDDENSRTNFVKNSRGTAREKILEDLLGDPLKFDHNKNYFNQDYLLNKNKETPLLGMVRACHYKCIPVVNTECRLVETSSESGLAIPGNVVSNYMLKTINEIALYTDSRYLKKVYSYILEDINRWRQTQFFRNVINQDETIFKSARKNAGRFQHFLLNNLVELYVTEYVEALENQANVSHKPQASQKRIIKIARQNIHKSLMEASPVELSENVLTEISSMLIDAKILHEIYVRNNKRHIIVCAGLIHIDNVIQRLREAGYKLLHDRIGENVFTVFSCNQFYLPVNIEQYFDQECCVRYQQEPGSVNISAPRRLLRRAIASGNGNIVRQLINITDEKGRTELIRAVILNDYNYVIKLLNNNAQTFIRDQDGKTALAWACDIGHFDLARALTRVMLRHGIDLSDNNGRTPLHGAVYHNDASFIHDLINHGANPNQQTHDMRTALHYAVTGTTAKLNSIRALLSRGANPNIVTNQGLTPLHVLVQNNPKHCTAAIHYLCRNGANVNALIPDMTYPCTALAFAIENSNTAAVQVLVQHGADITHDPHKEVCQAKAKKIPEIAQLVVFDKDRELGENKEKIVRTLVIHDLRDREHRA